MSMYIPDEMVIEILSRLPVKSLLRCRSVCRVWHDVIDSPKFVEHQMYRSASLCGRNRIGPLLFQRANLQTLNFSLTLLHSDTLAVAEEVKIPASIPSSFDGSSYWSVIGSCNGLVAISIFPIGVFQSNRDVDRVVIWNPATKQIRELPTPIIVERQLLDYGFVYLSSVEDYKVVRIVSRGNLGGMNGDFSIRVEVYSMQSDSWREIDTGSICPIIMHSMRFMIHSSGVAVKGILHWPVFFPSASHSNDTGSIISFDMVHELFREIQMPDAFSVSFDSRLRILELNGLLALASSTSRESTLIDIWVMREYGNSESWSKVMSFGGADCMNIWFLGSWINGEVILGGKWRERNHLMLFEPSSKKSIKHVEYDSNWDISQACNYYETLTPVGR
ncbi:F-box/kelch-repeat protein At3g23880-like [Impatiens glandulifera]|uniref:F-box/kelch-repeat protein At3g23880-like n=1 Tax=Impatiens glandulifera TaxID=253017 RepID=UPI001FB138FF|nr:F-box/kelch-repeat protein At3g23880-like [Impatiens glandulifera]XP_047313145.1 F-box/kelch-repeat protein At3g23880-like [Impatiens glandulifera]